MYKHRNNNNSDNSNNNIWYIYNIYTLLSPCEVDPGKRKVAMHDKACTRCSVFIDSYKRLKNYSHHHNTLLW